MTADGVPFNVEETGTVSKLPLVVMEHPLVDSVMQAIGETDLCCPNPRGSWLILLPPFIGEADRLIPFLCDVGVRLTAGPFKCSRFFAIRLNLILKQIFENNC